MAPNDRLRELADFTDEDPHSSAIDLAWPSSVSPSTNSITSSRRPPIEYGENRPPAPLAIAVGFARLGLQREAVMRNIVPPLHRCSVRPEWIER
jgi:hypothetical protein